MLLYLVLKKKLFKKLIQQKSGLKRKTIYGKSGKIPMKNNHY